jgi:hypothetical protein
MPPATRRIALVAFALALAACGSRPTRGEAGAPKAVVLSSTAKAAESERIAVALHERGYDVIRKSTTIVRDRSSAAVYGAHDTPERVDEITELLHDDLGLPIEILPFQQHATGGNFVVVWLGEDAADK